MIRKANITDAEVIYALINSWSKKGNVLERSLNNIFENIRDFWVYEDKNILKGCCAFHIIGWQNLGEVKSLVVAKKYHRQGIGKKLVQQCLQEAQDLKVKNVFALTFVPQFFKKLGFKKTNKKNLPHKIWHDCINCIYFPNCHEEAVIIKLDQRLKAKYSGLFLGRRKK